MVTSQGPEDDERAALVTEQLAQLLSSSTYQWLHGIVRRRGFSESEALDILDTAIAGIYKRLVEKGPVDGELAAYCTVTVHNAIARYKRDESRSPVDLPGDEILATLSANLDSRAEGPPESLPPEQQRLLEVSLIALAELPPYLREPYESEVYGRLRPAEIASILGKSPQSTRANLSVARAYVKRRVSELLEPGDDDRKGEDE